MFTKNEEIKATATPHRRVGFSRPGVGGLKSALQRQDSRSIAALLLGALFFAPQAALANPGGLCGAQTTDGLSGTADTITCDPNESYPDGISYTSDGDLTLEVLPNDPVDLDVDEEGVSVTNGDAADNLFWDSGSFTAGEIAGTGILIDYTSDAGNIDILTGGIVKGLDDATHAIRAESTGGGDVSITTQGDVNRRVSSSDPDPSGTGIEALTTSGNITINASGIVESGRAGGQYGVHAGSSAGGNIDISTTASVANRSDDGTHAILAETTGTGNIGIDIGGSVFGLGDSTTHAIQARSTGVGNIDIDAAGFVLASGSGNNDTTAIEAVTDGGNIDIALNGEEIEGRRRGVYAQTSGAGTVTINALGEISGFFFSGWVGGATADMAVVEAYSGTGNIDLNLGNVEGDRNSDKLGLQGGIIAETAGDVVINSIGLIQGSTVAGGGAAIKASGNQVTVNLQGSGTADNIAEFDATIGGTINNLGGAGGFSTNPLTGGHVDFSGVTGSVEMNFDSQSKWVVTGDSVMSAGHDVVNISSDSAIHSLMGSSGGQPNLRAGPHMAIPGTIDFDGGGTINNQGTVMVGPFRNSNPLSINEIQDVPAELRFDNLDSFNNSGTIWLGTHIRTSGFMPTTVETEGWYDDILAMPGAAFHGSGNSRIELDASLNLVGSPDDTCTADSRNADDDLRGSDCINLRGGTASGRTEIVFNTLVPGDRGSLNPHGLLIVDLAGGSADPDAFVISPDSDFYSPQFGGVIDKGLFFFPLAYDADGQQFRLYGQPSSAAQQLPILGNAANDLWRTVTSGWFDRQTDQRTVRLDPGLGGGVWMRVTASSAERDLITPIVAGIETFEFDNSYTQDDSALTLGVDLISRGAGNRALVVGAMLGYARSRIDFDAHPNTANLEGGPHVGVYGSLTFGDFYLDAAVNGVWLDLDYDAPSLDLFPETAILNGDITSIGGRLDAGWDGLSFGRLGISPLASLSYVKADYRDLEVPAGDPERLGANFTFQDPESLRAGLGVRLSLTDVLPGFAPTDLGLTARVMNESEGESTATITSTGPFAVDQTDTFDGTFTEITGSVSVSNTAKTVTGFLNVDGTFESDYESVGIEAGFRYQW